MVQSRNAKIVDTFAPKLVDPPKVGTNVRTVRLSAACECPAAASSRRTHLGDELFLSTAFAHLQFGGNRFEKIGKIAADLRIEIAVFVHVGTIQNPANSNSVALRCRHRRDRHCVCVERHNGKRFTRDLVLAWLNLARDKDEGVSKTALKVAEIDIIIDEC